MKKVLFVFSACLILLTGCEKVSEGNYKEGTYAGSVEFESYGQKYVTTAVIYVDDSGLIKSVYLDSTYEKDGVSTTKKTLGDAYGMKETSASIGNIEGGSEWYEQVEVIENKVIEEQGIDWAVLKDDKTLDSISGVTITADTYIEAIDKAIKKAK